jgi:hypothetical protein
VVGGAVLALACIDLAQRGHSLRRNYPGGADPLADGRAAPFSRAYLVDSDLDGRPFSHEERSGLCPRAWHGGRASVGTQLDVYSEEYEWLAHSMAPNSDAPRDMRVAVGSSQCAQPIPPPLNISAMSFGAGRQCDRGVEPRRQAGRMLP